MKDTNGLVHTKKYYIKRGHHIHTLVEMPPKMSVSSFVGFIKGKSSLK